MDSENMGDRFKEWLEEIQKSVYIDGEYIVLDTVSKYEIELSRLDTPEKLIHWIWHLCEKQWMTNDMMRRFISLVCTANNIKPTSS